MEENKKRDGGRLRKRTTKPVSIQVQGDPDEDAIIHDVFTKLLDPKGCKQERIMGELPMSLKRKKLFLSSVCAGNIKNHIPDCRMM